MTRFSEFAAKLAPKILTWGLVVIAVVSSVFLYDRWTSQPWTRDGQVRADIVKVAPQVEGYLVKLHVRDNQLVRKGDLLFEIDTESFELASDKGREALEQARDDAASQEASVRVAEAQYEQARISVTSTERKILAAEANIKSAAASVDQAMAGIAAAEQLINQRAAELTNAKSESVRAQRLVDKKAGSVEDAESTAATAVAKEAQLASAKAGLAQAQATLKQAEASDSASRVDLLTAQDALAGSRAAAASALAALEQAKAALGKAGENNVRVRSARTSLAQAELDLKHTRILAPCNGYISNLSVAVGTYAVIGQPLVAVVDSDSFRVHAYFQETKLRYIHEGDLAVVTLMGHPDSNLEGRVDNIGNAVNPPNIAPTEGVAGEIPQIQPTFDWVRLPQRVPVRIRLTDVPVGIQLISGMTASVAIKPTAEE